MRKLSKVEIDYIIAHRDVPVKQLSEDLSRPESSVEKVLAELPPTQPDPPKRQRGKVFEYITPKENDGKPKRGMIVMTEAGSQHGDESPSKKTNSRHTGAIKKIFEE
jgi:hypothetical protein